jgi:phage regulator Rha-like protein
MKTESIAAQAAPVAADVAVVVQEGEPRVDSRQLAGPLGVPHSSLYRLLKRYKADFGALDHVGFEIQHGGARRPQGGGMRERYAMLTEDQSYLLLAYTKNTPEARALKQRLVLAFRAARDRLEGRVTIDRSEYEHAMRVEVDANVSQALGSIGGKLLAKRRVEKPLFERQIAELRVTLQLTLPWPK